ALQAIAHESRERVRGGHAEAAAGSGRSAGRVESTAAPAAPPSAAAPAPAGPAGAPASGAPGSPTAGPPAPRSAGARPARAGAAAEERGDGLRGGALARTRDVASRPDRLGGEERLQEPIPQRGFLRRAGREIRGRHEGAVVDGRDGDMGDAGGGQLVAGEGLVARGPGVP